MPLLWNGPDGAEENITPPHSFTSREGVISALIYPIKECIFTVQRGEVHPLRMDDFKKYQSSQNISIKT